MTVLIVRSGSRKRSTISAIGLVQGLFLGARRRSGFVLAAVVAGATMLTGCSPTDKPQPSSPVASSEASGDDRSAGARYRTVDDLCAHVDLAPLIAALGAAGAYQGQAYDVAGITEAMCSTTLGEMPEGAFVQVNATTGAPGSGQDIFDSLRLVHQTDGVLDEIVGLGSDAYTYESSQTGRFVVTHDGNLYLTVAVIPALDDVELPADLVDRMTEVVRSIMSRLRE
ncbi:hypothetical protein [Micromonospora sp. NPDC003241]